MRLDHLRALGNQVSVSIPPDQDGFTGRECPVPECEGYFKIEFGTGLKGQDLPCHCPYCGHVDSHNKFFTREQIEYAKSVVLNRVTDAFLKDLKGLEFESKPRGTFGIGLSLKAQGRPQPIRYYREKRLETEVVCDSCTLRYAIYGVFAFCPDCGVHNSLQILHKNLDLCLKELDLASKSDQILSEHLTGDALENAVSAFDGFGREACRVAALALGDSARGEKLSFQNLVSARDRLRGSFMIDIVEGVSEQEWEFACRCFQKRHLLAHKMGVVDDAYITATRDSGAVVGRKVSVRADEVRALTDILRKLGAHLFKVLPSLSKLSGE